MTPYGKVAQAALCATSLLAEHYDPEHPKRFSSGEVAKNRKISQAIAAKVLTVLSQAGVVTGSPGPGGGYALARAPEEITLLEVVAPFERSEPNTVCPYGDGWCGKEAPCPLHDQLLKFRSDVTHFLKSTTLHSFKTTKKQKR